MTLLRPALALLLVSAAPTALAQSADPVDGVLSCRGIADVEARLACFDAAADRLASARATGEIVIVTEQDVEAVERDSFGFDLPSLPRLRLPGIRLRSGGGSNDAFADLGQPETPPETPAEAPGEAPTATQPAPAGTQLAEARPAVRPAPAAEPEPAPGEAVILARAEDGGIEVVSMEIERIREVGYRDMIFYMVNGQVWRTIDQEFQIRLPRNREGLVAVIRRGAMSSYLMQINDRGRAIRVERQR